MSSQSSSGRHRLVVPVTAAAILVVIAVGFFATRGGDEAPAKPAATASKTPAAVAATAKLKGSGDAPEAIAVKDATVARSATALGLAAELPGIDLDLFDTITVVMGQDGGDVRWRLESFRDPRGAFVTPQLYLVGEGPDEQYACNGAAIRIKGTRLTSTLPLACLDEPGKPLQVRLELEDRDGGSERTSTSKTLTAPKKG